MRGFEGFVYGEAADAKLRDYYIDNFRAIPIPFAANSFGIMIDGTVMKSIREVYDYDWSDLESL